MHLTKLIGVVVYSFTKQSTLKPPFKVFLPPPMIPMQNISVVAPQKFNFTFAKHSANLHIPSPPFPTIKEESRHAHALNLWKRVGCRGGSL
jgi:hypothetical protein